MIEEGQTGLFGEEDFMPWWQSMPEYSIEDLAPQFQIVVNFACAADVEDFGKIIGQNIKARNGKQLQSVWFPEQEIGHMVNKRYIEAGK